MITNNDRLILILEGFKIPIGEFLEQYRKAKDITILGAGNTLRSWLQHTNNCREVANVGNALDVLRPSSGLSALMTEDIDAQEFLVRCSLDFYAVATRTVFTASPDTKFQLSAHFHAAIARTSLSSVSVIRELADQILTNDRSGFARNQLLRARGQWTLYRRHSSMLGVLRETVIIKDVRLFHAEGTYYQFSAGSAPGDAPAHRAISTSIFHCGDSITAWSSLILGGSSPNLRFDPVVVTALLRPYALPKPRNQYHFPGLLLALADSTSVPTAMRIILRQDTRSPQLSGVNADNPAAFVEDAQELALYETAVSNVLPGHVLALGHSARDMSNNLNLSWLAMQS